MGFKALKLAVLAGAMLVGGGTALAAPTDVASVNQAMQEQVMLRHIDAAFDAGSLTYDEARALYTEQSAIRAHWIAALASEDQAAGARRVAFMLRTSQGTLARLTYNDTRRHTEPQRPRLVQR